jgi:hypothetical protein
MTPESQTPRTDAVTQRIGGFETAGGYHNEEVVVSANFARQLERELAAEKAARVKAEAELVGFTTASQQIAEFRARADAAEQDVKRLQELLSVAKCPNCDGSGTVMKGYTNPEYVSHDMAVDAGDRTLEGSIYREAEPIIEQCQWCAERAALHPAPAQKT